MKALIKNTISGLEKQIGENKQDSEQKIVQLRHERDEAKSALASWMLLGQSQMTNTPLTQRLDILLAQFEEISGSITNNERPEFVVNINGKVITNQETVALDPSRKLRIVAINNGAITAERIVLEFVISRFSITNIVHDGWEEQGPLVTDLGDGRVWEDNDSAHLRVLSLAPLAGSGNGFIAPPLIISTNLPGGSLSCMIFVYSEKSKLQKYYFKLRF